MTRAKSNLSLFGGAGSGGAALVWLTLALEGCGMTADPGMSGGTGPESSGGASTGGRVVSTDGGRSAGGNSAGGAPAGGSSAGGWVNDADGLGGSGGTGPTVLSLEHANGFWNVQLENTEGFYSQSCVGAAPSLLETDPPKGRTSLPPYGEYFLDGAYVNIPRNLGCDFIVCEPFSSHVGLFDQGVVSVGTLPNTGGEGGAGPEIPAFEHYDIDGPFVFTNSYYTDSECTKLVTEAPQILTP